MVPPHTHDWRLYVKPHELGFLLQACTRPARALHAPCTRPARALHGPLHACAHCACALPLQAHGFLCDTGHFRGLMPTLDPRQLLRTPPAGWSARLPSPPLSDFVEISSLEVNYMGWAVKSELAGSGGAAAEVTDPDAATRGGEESLPKEHAPGALAKGLRDFERRS